MLVQVKSKPIEDSKDFFPDPEWTTISPEAKALVLAMLDRDPAKRPTTAQLLARPSPRTRPFRLVGSLANRHAACADPWMVANENTAAIPTIARLRKFNAKRKLRAAYFALKATNRMAALIQSMRATQEAVKFAQKYTLEHVENLYDAFDEASERSGSAKALGRDDFLSVLGEVLDLQDAPGRDMAEAHFDAFANRGSAGGGSAINYQEYILALSTTFARGTEERLKFAFEIVDADGSGTIEREEFCELVESMLARTQSHVDASQIRAIAEREFTNADTNHDGVLSIDEFVVAAQQVTPAFLLFSFPLGGLLFVGHTRDGRCRHRC